MNPLSSDNLQLAVTVLIIAALLYALMNLHRMLRSEPAKAGGPSEPWGTGYQPSGGLATAGTKIQDPTFSDEKILEIISKEIKFGATGGEQKWVWVKGRGFLHYSHLTNVASDSDKQYQYGRLTSFEPTVTAVFCLETGGGTRHEQVNLALNVRAFMGGIPEITSHESALEERFMRAICDFIAAEGNMGGLAAVWNGPTPPGDE